MLSFKLTMPRVGSWNGQWTGETKKYFRIRKVSLKKQNELNGRSFYYDFGDGWGARVFVEKIDAREAKKRRRISDGFCGYDWMIDEILTYGHILTKQERKEKRIIEEIKQKIKNETNN